MPEDRSPIDALVAAWTRRAATIPLAVLSSPVARMTDDNPVTAYVCRAGTGSTLAEHGVLVMVDVDDHEVFAAPIAALGAEPVGLEIEAEALRVDLRRLVPPNSHPKHVLVRALLRRQVSDARPIELTESRVHASWTGSDGAWVKSTVFGEHTLHDRSPLGAGEPSDETSSGLLPWPPPGDPYPDYRQRPTSPVLPDFVGIELAIPRVLVRATHEPWILEGAYRLSARIEDRAPPRDTPPIEGAEPEITAIVRGALVIVGSDDTGPWIAPLRLPSYAPIHPTRLTATATGFLALDLLASADITPREQTYFVHLFAGNAYAGPSASALLSPETVRAEVEAARTPV